MSLAYKSKNKIHDNATVKTLQQGKYMLYDNNIWYKICKENLCNFLRRILYDEGLFENSLSSVHVLTWEVLSNEPRSCNEWTLVITSIFKYIFGYPFEGVIDIPEESGVVVMKMYFSASFFSKFRTNSL